MYGPRMAGGGGCRADRMSRKVPKVGMGDSSSSSDTDGPSLGSDLCMFLKALSLLTQLLLRMTISISEFIASTSHGVWGLGGRCCVCPRSCGAGARDERVFPRSAFTVMVSQGKRGNGGRE